MIGLILLLALPLGAPAGSQPVTTVDAVDLTRYAGEWFELARYPNRFQDQCAGDVRATYALRPDGRLDVVNRCRTTDGKTSRAEGIARVADRDSRAKLKVRFAPAMLSWLPFVWGDYWVIGLDADYRWAVVGSPDRKYLWVLARTPSLDEAAFQAGLQRARANGFDTDRLVRTPHE